MILRSTFKLIQQALTYFPVIGILGPRQVGKTTLVKQIQAQLPHESILLDLERDSDLQKLNEAELFLTQYQNKTVIIDEIQQMPSLLPLLRWLVDQDRRPARFILTGSATLDLIKTNTETLAGRIAYFELLPFSILEVNDQKSLREHWFRGGFHGSLFAPSHDVASFWMDNFINTYLYRDLRKMGQDISIQSMEKLLKLLASVHGNILQIESISKNLGISVNTIKKYLDILEGSFIVRRLQPYHINTTKRLVKAPKIYIRDSGLLHCLASIQSAEQLYGNILLGHSWESYVLEEIIKVAGKKYEYSFYRAHTGAEIDLVLKNVNTNVITAVEIKYSINTNPTKGFYTAIEDVQAEYKCIIVPEGEAYFKSEGIKVSGLEWFLKSLK